MNKKAVIFGIKSYKLSNLEKKFLKKEKPWGIILFSRNIKNINQLRHLVKGIKALFGQKNYPILIDQEGGAVSRLNKIINLNIFTQEYFGQLYKKDKVSFYSYFKIYINSVCSILNFIGININTVPVLDVRRIKSHKIIGSRSFSTDPSLVSKLGKLSVNLYTNNNIATVIKHIPGHGLSKSDSHYKTPVIKAKKNELMKKDFLPFKNSKSLFAMTAHILYEKYDKFNVATHSKEIIKLIIRKHMSYKGLIISDDISMKSLKLGLENNALKALQAGCNLVLHCNGNIKEMSRLAKVIPKIDNFTQKKTTQFYKFLR